MLRLRLQTKILGYFGPVVAFALLGALWLVDLHMNNRVKDAAREQLGTSRRVFEELLATRAEGLVTAASLVAELGVLYQPLELTDPARLEHACRRVNQLIGSEVVIVTDRMGVILARTDRRWEVGETFRETTAVARALRGERASTMWVQDGRLYAMVSVPLRLPTGLAGTISVGYRVDGMFAVQLALLSGQDVAFLVGSHVVASSRTLEPAEARLVGELSSRIRDGHAVYGTVDLASGIPAIVVSPFSGIGGAPIASYAILRSLAGEAAELRALERQLALIAGVALAGALGVGFLISRSIARPLTKLAAASHELGGGNYDFRLPPPAGASEVQDLTQAFEAMRQSLKARIGELHRLAEQLEQMVGDRTAALESALAENRKLLETLRQWNDALERKVEERTHELAEAQKMIILQDRMAAVGRLAAGVAHEINNPLGILAGFAEGLLDRSRDPKLAAEPAFREFPEYLRLIGQEVDRLKTIVQRFLHFARSRAPEKQLIDVNGIARQVIELLANHARGEGKELGGDLNPLGVWVEADPEQLKQVLLNLAMNGLDAVERRGRVRIETRTRGDVAEIAVRDNGSGVPEEFRERIFEPFFSTKPPEKGTGLGLALCHDLVTENGGEIELRESGAGAGSEFVIRLPLSTRTELRVHA